MTLRLFLMRHGKSDWSAGSGRDHERPLAQRGIQAVLRMGQCLSTGEQLPELIVSSTAVRARSTADLLVQGAQTSIPIEMSDAFYESTPERVLADIKKRKDDVSSLMIVGHEPTWSSLASQLIGGGELAFPTGAIARIDFDCEHWTQVAKGRGVLKWLLQPKLFRHN